MKYSTVKNIAEMLFEKMRDECYKKLLPQKYSEAANILESIYLGISHLKNTIHAKIGDSPYLELLNLSWQGSVGNYYFDNLEEYTPKFSPFELYEFRVDYYENILRQYIYNSSSKPLSAKLLHYLILNPLRETKVNPNAIIHDSGKVISILKNYIGCLDTVLFPWIGKLELIHYSGFSNALLQSDGSINIVDRELSYTDLLSNAHSADMMNESEQALVYCDRALLKKPHEPHAFGIKGIILLKLGHRDKAMLSFEHCIARLKLIISIVESCKSDIELFEIEDFDITQHLNNSRSFNRSTSQVSLVLQNLNQSIIHYKKLMEK